MSKKRVKKLIKYKKERVVLSDVLPFEIPITFSNRHFYDFLVSEGIEIRQNRMRWNNNNPTLVEISKLLFDFRSQPISTNEIPLGKKLNTIPFKYKISHKDNDFRELTVIHPKNQVALVDFYNEYKHLILYHSELSPFSIRKPVRIARAIYFNDATGREDLSKSEAYDQVEEYGKEYQNLKTFFVYKNYSNIHKFYESYKFHRCEKKYNSLFKFDISKCFDSIYTHSISWALLNKSIVKDSLGESKSTFSGKFDTLMQCLNYGETNGIIIGPEVSRIFAELILQRVDFNVEVSLKSAQTSPLIHKKDYEIFRYVDDYFVFYNDENTRDRILKEFRVQLKDFKLYLNDKKTQLYNKPIITEITIAKQRIVELFNEYLSPFKIVDRLDSKSQEDDLSGRTSRIYANSNRLITKFKIVIQETGTEYKDIINFTLALIERKIAKILSMKNELVIDSVERALLEILDFTFFIYSVWPRVNTTIKLCRIISVITVHLKDVKIEQSYKRPILKRIYDNIFFVLQKNRTTEYTQVETLYLLIALHELGSRYWLETDVLCDYVGIRVDGATLTYNGDLNYFVIVVLLFYIKDKNRYSSIREFIKGHVISRMEKISKKNRGKTAEMIFLLFDLLTCPYLDNDFKRRILNLNGVSDLDMQLRIIRYRQHWFTKWNNFDFGRELDTKQSKDVY